jgi:alcohol dehydrogenase, propanol-preferring
MSNMRAAVLRRPAANGPPPVRLTDVDEPRPGAGQLLVEVLACAVCRTDLQIVRGDLAAHRLPLIPGHQVVGRVAQIGEGVSDWAVGDRAGAFWLAWSCGTCPQCSVERENLCPEARFTGWDVDGGYAQRMVVNADFAVRLADGDALDLAPLLCGGVIGYRALQRSGIQPGERLGLYGFGASASLAIQVARHWECEVYVVTRAATDRKRALQLGASWAGDGSELPPVPLDAAVTFAPVGAVVVQALRALGPGGTVAINAIHLDQVPAFDYDWLWMERTITSVANVTRADAREFMALAAEIGIATNAIPYQLAEASRALGDLEEGKIGAGAAVLQPVD